MPAPKDLDELWDQMGAAFARLDADPKRMLQTRELTNAAGKMIDIVKCKIAACALNGVKTNIPQMGVHQGDPLKMARTIDSKPSVTALLADENTKA